MKDQLKNFFFSLNFFSLRVTGKKIQPFENSDFQTRFSRDWDIFGKNGYVRWIRLKKFFKMSKSCFFQKKWPNGLNLRVSRSPNSWWRELNFFQNFFKTQWKDRYFVQKKMTNKSLKIIRVYLVPRYAAKFLKPYLGCENQKNGDISGSSGQNFYRFFLSCFSSKNTSFKKKEKKIQPTPTQPGPKHAKSFNLRKNP